MKKKYIKTLLPVFAIGLFNSLSFGQALTFDWANSTDRIYEQNTFEDSFCDGESITTDNNGNVIYSGTFGGKVDFDPGINAIETSYLITESNGFQSTEDDGYVSKLNSNGELIWAMRVYTSNYGLATGVEKVLTDNSNNIYIFGYFSDDLKFEPLNATTTITGTTTPGYGNAFIAKLSPSGIISWVKTYNGANIKFFDAAIDNSGNIVSSIGSDSPIADNSGGALITSLTDRHIAILKLNNSGTLTWAKSCNIPNTSSIGSLATDASGNIFVGGPFDDFNSNIDADPGAGTATILSNGGSDIYLFKLNSSGLFQWVKTIGTPNNDRLYSLEVDGNGDVIAGIWNANNSNPWDVDPGAGTNLVAQNEGLLWKLNTNGLFQWATTIGWANAVNSISVDGSNNLFVLNNGTFQKYNSSGVYLMGAPNTLNVLGNDMVLDNSDNIYMTGNIFGSIEADPTLSDYYLNAAGAFNLKWGQLLPSIVQFTSPVVTKNENAGTVTVSLSLSQASAISETVEIYIQDISTSFNIDYTVNPNAATFTKTIPAGSTTTSFTISIIDDLIVESDESLTATITATSSGLIVGTNGSMTLTIIDNEPTSLFELSSENLISYPNPTLGTFTIELGEVVSNLSVNVYDALGRIVLTKKFDSADSIMLDIDGLPGYYIVEINTDEGKSARVNVIKE